MRIEAWIGKTVGNIGPVDVESQMLIETQCAGVIEGAGGEPETIGRRCPIPNDLQGVPHQESAKPSSYVFVNQAEIDQIHIRGIGAIQFQEAYRFSLAARVEKVKLGIRSADHLSDLVPAVRQTTLPEPVLADGPEKGKIFVHIRDKFSFQMYVIPFLGFQQRRGADHVQIGHPGFKQREVFVSHLDCDIGA